MEINKIKRLENGSQLGIEKNIHSENDIIFYCYAVQKYGGVYYIYERELPENEPNYFDNCREEIHKAETIEQIFSQYPPRYGINIDEIAPLKGNRIFNVKFYAE